MDVVNKYRTTQDSEVQVLIGSVWRKITNYLFGLTYSWTADGVLKKRLENIKNMPSGSSRCVVVCTYLHYTPICATYSVLCGFILDYTGCYVQDS